MPEIKFTFSGEERGLIASALRSAGAIDAAGKAAAAATGQLSKQDAAILKLALRFHQLEKAKEAASKKLDLATSTGASETALKRLSDNYAKLKQQAESAHLALASGKIDSMNASMGSLSGNTNAAGGAFSKLGLFAVSATTAIAGLVAKAADMGKEGLQEASAATTEQNKAQPIISKAAIGGDKNAKEFIDQIRADTGVSAEKAAHYYDSLRASGEDNQQGRALVQQLTGTVESPEQLLENAAKLKTADVGFKSARQVVDVSLAASAIEGVKAKPTEISSTLLSIASSGKGIGASAAESTGFMALALHMTKDPEKAAAASKNIANVITSRNQGGKGFEAGMEGVAAQMPEGFFSEDKKISAAAMRPMVGGNGAFGNIEEAETFKRMYLMLKERPEVKKTVQAAYDKTGRGDVLDVAYQAQTPEQKAELKASRLAAQEEVDKSKVYGIEAKNKEGMLSAIGDASVKQGEWEGSAGFRKFMGGMAYDITKVFGGSDKSALNAGFNVGGAEFVDDGIERQARKSFSQAGDDVVVTQQNTEATHALNETLKELNTTLKAKQTDTRMPLPTASPNYQRNQPAWGNRE